MPNHFSVEVKNFILPSFAFTMSLAATGRRASALGSSSEVFLKLSQYL